MATFYVKIFYGPTETHNLLTEHKPQYLTGLRLRLQQLGFRVDLVPVEYIDYCMLTMCGHMIFRCNIKSLLFNTPAHMDPVCLNAVDAVIEARDKFNRTRSFLWIFVWLERQMFKRSEFTSQSYWIADLPPLPPDLADFRECLGECCKVLTTQADEDAPKVTAEAVIDPIEAFCDEINQAYGNAPIDQLGEYQDEDINVLELALSSKQTMTRSGVSIRGFRSEDRDSTIARKSGLLRRPVGDQTALKEEPGSAPEEYSVRVTDGTDELFIQASDIFKQRSGTFD